MFEKLLKNPSKSRKLLEKRNLIKKVAKLGNCKIQSSCFQESQTFCFNLLNSLEKYKIKNPNMFEKLFKNPSKYRKLLEKRNLIKKSGQIRQLSKIQFASFQESLTFCFNLLNSLKKI